MANEKCSKCQKVLTESTANPSVLRQGSGWCKECRSKRDAKRKFDPLEKQRRILLRKQFWGSLSQEEKERRQQIEKENDKKRYKELTPEKKNRRVKQAVASRRRRDTGVSKEEFEKRFLNQKGLCDICGKFMSRPCQDHNHTTKKPRDLLCHNCNVLIGHSFENKEILASAIRYLQKHTNDSSI